jgi:hypothetical protein
MKILDKAQRSSMNIKGDVVRKVLAITEDLQQ